MPRDAGERGNADVLRAFTFAFAFAFGRWGDIPNSGTSMCTSNEILRIAIQGWEPAQIGHRGARGNIYFQQPPDSRKCVDLGRGTTEMNVHRFEEITILSSTPVTVTVTEDRPAQPAPLLVQEICIPWACAARPPTPILSKFGVEGF